MASVRLVILLSVLAVAVCADYTVTDEAWFDVEIKDHYGAGEDYRGRFVIALFGDSAPMTVLNFRHIVKGYKRGNEELHYKNTPVHRVVTDFVIQMGDVTVGDGTGGKSIFGDTFNDEDFVLSHKAAGYVSMANHGKDTNGSQFFILLNKARWLDGKHVIFGKVVKGMDVVRNIGDTAVNRTNATPINQVMIIDCGLNDLDSKYTLTDQQSVSDNDI